MVRRLAAHERATICGLAGVLVAAGGASVLPVLPAVQASLVYPVDVVAMGDGVVVADFKAHGLLAIDAAGSVSAIAIGNGLPRTPLYGTRAVLDAPDGDGWLVADPATSSLYRVRADGSIMTITDAVDIPQGLARFDDSSVLVSDLRSGIGAVMKVGLDGEVSVFAEIDSPKGIVEDGDGGFALVSHGDRAVVRLSRGGDVSTLHRGAPLLFPHDLVRLPSGDFVVSDGYAHALFTVSAEGEVTALAQGAPLIAPQGIARLANGTLIVVDPQAGAVFRVAPDGAVHPWVAVQGAGVGPARR
jgi:hypothetical protein